MQFHLEINTTQFLTQKFPLSLLHKRKWVGNHKFLHGDITQKDILIEVEFEENFFNFSLLNKTVPHRVPTADNGDPRLYLYITFLNAAGELVDKNKWIIAPQQDTALLFNKKMAFSYRLFVPVTQANIILKYQPAWSKEKTIVRSKTVRR